MLPTFRPDKALPSAFENQPYNEYLDKLETAAGLSIKNFDDLRAALKNRHEFFHKNGCRLSDHGFGVFHYDDNCGQQGVDNASESFDRLRSGNVIDDDAVLILQSFLLRDFAEIDAEKGWTMQLHIGAIRNNNSDMYHQLGADAGFDSIALPVEYFEQHLGCFFDDLDGFNALPQMIVYNLNPAINEVIATMLGNFQTRADGAGAKPSKMQFGSGWWFLDQKDGMEKQLNCLSNLGLLSQFVGMLTDSRSFLSYTRHEYFRRILCNLLGQDIKDGLIPNDIEFVGKMVQDICCNNAKNYFNFP
jgi:glucuronate isomerase